MVLLCYSPGVSDRGRTGDTLDYLPSGQGMGGVLQSLFLRQQQYIGRTRTHEQREEERETGSGGLLLTQQRASGEKTNRQTHGQAGRLAVVVVVVVGFLLLGPPRYGRVRTSSYYVLGDGHHRTTAQQVDWFSFSCGRRYWTGCKKREDGECQPSTLLFSGASTSIS